MAQRRVSGLRSDKTLQLSSKVKNIYEVNIPFREVPKTARTMRAHKYLLIPTMLELWRGPSKAKKSILPQRGVNIRGVGRRWHLFRGSPRGSGFGRASNPPQIPPQPPPQPPFTPTPSPRSPTHPPTHAATAYGRLGLHMLLRHMLLPTTCCCPIGCCASKCCCAIHALLPRMATIVKNSQLVAHSSNTTCRRKTTTIVKHSGFGIQLQHKFSSPDDNNC